MGSASSSLRKRRARRTVRKAEAQSAPGASRSRAAPSVASSSARQPRAARPPKSPFKGNIKGNSQLAWVNDSKAGFAFQEPPRVPEIDFCLKRTDDLQRVSGLLTETWRNDALDGNTDDDERLSDDEIKLVFKKQQLRIRLDETIAQLAAVAKRSSEKERTIFVSHTWPGHVDEDDLLETVISFNDTLRAAGLHVSSAMLSWRDADTSYPEFIKAHMKEVDAVVYAASPSFRSEYDREASCIAADRAAVEELSLDPLPIVLVGGFGDSLPSTLTHVLASVCSSPEAYCKLMPAFVATLLNIQDNSDAKKVLEQHDSQVEVLIKSLEEPTLSQDDISTVVASYHEERQRLQLRAFVLKSNLTRSQRRLLDNGLQQQVDAIGQVAIKRMRGDQQQQQQQQQQAEASAASKDILVNSGQENKENKTKGKQGEATQEGATLSSMYTEFMSGDQAIMLVVGEASLLSQAEDMLIGRQWGYYDTHHAMIPVVIDLEKVENPVSRIVEQALLLQHGYTPKEIEALREGHPGLVIFLKNWRAAEHCTNIYVQNELEHWGSLHGSAPKVVFLVEHAEVASVLTTPAAAATAAKGVITTAVASGGEGEQWQLPPVLHPRLLGEDIEGPIVLYFLPCDMGREPIPTAFRMAKLAGVADTPPPPLEGVKFSEAKSTTSAAAGAAAKKEGSAAGGGGEAGRDTLVDMAALRARCLHSVHQTYVTARERLVRKQLNRDLNQLKSLFGVIAGVRPDNRKKGFISYSWPRAQRDQRWLQGRLNQMRSDLRPAGFDVKLDIMDLKAGMDIDEFMREGVEKSDVMFLIGTPDYNRRVPEPSNRVEKDNIDKEEVTNVGKEYCFIRDAAANKDVLVFPLWFDRGEHVTPLSAFPKGFQEFPFQRVQDCSSYSRYLAALPALLSALMPVVAEGELSEENRKKWDEACETFANRLRDVEAATTVKAVWEWFFRDLRAQEEEERKYQEMVKEFFTNTPAEVLEQLAGSRDSATAALEANITRIRQATDVLKPESPVQQQLKQFVRVLASKVAAPKKDEEKFDLVDNVLSTLAQKCTEQDPAFLLIQGGTGSGKSAFIRFLEFKLWAAHDKDRSQPVPLYIPLAHAHNAETNLVEEALAAIGLDESGMEQLRREQEFVILLDGFDELGKPVNLYRSNKLDKWKAHVVVGARSQFLQSLSEYQSLFTHERQGSVDERYILPFNDDQIRSFLERFAHGSDAQGADAGSLYDELSSIGGLWDLLSTPFLLHMACLCLPILRSGLVPSKGLPRKITKRHLYESFVSLMHGREMWRCVTRRRVPININLHHELLEFDQDLARALLMHHSLQAKITREDGSSDAAVKIAIDGSPLRVVATGPRVAFVHKSVFEYLAAGVIVADLLALSDTDVVPLLGSRLLRDEPGLVEFAALLVRRDKEAQGRLLHILELSKSKPAAAMAAGNAFTILNAARVPFSGMDLRKARLCGADMRGALLHRTRFDNGDLRGALLAESLITGASFNGCNMRDVEFGQQPDVDEQTTPVHTLHVEGEGAKVRAMTVTTGKHINYWGLEKHKRSKGEEEMDLRLRSTAPLPPAVDHGDKDRFLPLNFSGCWNVMGVMPSDQRIDLQPVAGKEGAKFLPWSLETGAKIVVNTAWPFRNSIRIARGGERAAMVLRDNTLAVFERQEGGAKRIVNANLFSDLTQLAVNMHHKGEIDFVSCEFSPDGRYLAVYLAPLSIFGYTGEGDMEMPGSVYMYDLNSPGTAPRVFSKHENWIGNVAFLKNGAQLLSFGNDATLVTWDVESGEPVSVIEHVRSGEHHASRLKVSPSDKYCVTTDDTHGWSWSPHSCASLWRLTDGVRVSKLIGHDIGIVSGIAFSADESLLATTSQAKTVCVYETGEGKLVQVLRGHTSSVGLVAFLSNELVLSCAGKSMKLWSLKEATALPPITYNPSATELTSAEGPWTLQVCMDYVVGTHNTHHRRLGVWDRHTGELLPSLQGSYMDGPTRGLAVSVDGKCIFVGLNSSACLPIPQIDLEQGGKVVRALAVPQRRSPTHFHGNTLAMSADGKYLAATTLWRTSLLFDLEQGKQVGTLDGHSHDHVWGVVFSPDGTKVATSASDGKVLVFDVASQKKLCSVPSKDIDYGFNSRGQLVVADLKDKAVRILDVSGSSPEEVECRKEFAEADQLVLVFVCSRVQTVLGVRKGTTLSLHNVDDFAVEAVVESFCSNPSGLVISTDWTQLVCKKRHLNGVDVYRLDKEGSRMHWVTRPTFETNAKTSLVGCIGLPGPARQLLKQYGANID